MSSQTTKHLLALSAVIVINLLFSIKYGLRFNASPVFILFIIAGNLIPIVLYFISTHTKSHVISKVFQSTIITWGIPIAIIVLSAILFLTVNESALRVDRHEMIRLFWDNIFSGNCPYCPRSADTNIPGPFPFYFYAALPFYLIGELGYFSLLGIGLFAGAILYDRSLSVKSKNLILLVLVLSPAVWWEMVCRSTVFLNSAAILAGMAVFDKKYSGRGAQSMLFGVLFGLLLSTRSIAFLLVAQVVLYKLRFRIFSRDGLMLTVAAVIVFIGTFLPVIALCKGGFMQYNPFIVQSSLAPPVFYFFIALFSLWLAVRCRNFSSLSMVSGGTCLLIVAGYFVTTSLQGGLTKAFFGSGMDISYAVLSLPFLLYGLGQNASSERS